jgi:hypothetical protein
MVFLAAAALLTVVSAALVIGALTAGGVFAATAAFFAGGEADAAEAEHYDRERKNRFLQHGAVTPEKR